MFRKFLLALIAGALLLNAHSGLAQSDVGVRGGSRDRVPVISVKDFDLQRFEGKVVLIGIWQAVQCGTCADFIAWLSDMQGLYGEEGLVVVAVNQDLESKAATDLLNSIHKRALVVLDPTGKMGSALEIEDVPSTYLYDRNQNLTDKFAGFVKEETAPAEEAIKNLLAKKYKD